MSSKLTHSFPILTQTATLGLLAAIGLLSPGCDEQETSDRDESVYDSGKADEFDDDAFDCDPEIDEDCDEGALECDPEVDELCGVCTEEWNEDCEDYYQDKNNGLGAACSWQAANAFVSCGGSLFGVIRAALIHDYSGIAIAASAGSKCANDLGYLGDCLYNVGWGSINAALTLINVDYTMCLVEQPYPEGVCCPDTAGGYCVY